MRNYSLIYYLILLKYCWLVSNKIATLNLAKLSCLLKINSRSLKVLAGRWSCRAGTCRRWIRNSVNCWWWWSGCCWVLKKQLLHLQNVYILFQVLRWWDQCCRIWSVALRQYKHFIEYRTRLKTLMRAYLTDTHWSWPIRYNYEPDEDSSNALNCYRRKDYSLCSCYAVYCCYYCLSYHFRDA